MALDPHYVIAPSLEMYFVDKDSGLPLSGGQVFFFRDIERNVPKDVFELSGVQPNYTYTVLPNPSTLSSVGTFQDASGNDILPYYFPYLADGVTIDLYYIEVYNSNGVLQFTREGWPNLTPGDDNAAGENITNYVPNPQFLLHNNSPPGEPLSGAQVMSTVAYGGTIGTLNVWDIAPGGWTFEKNTGSTSIDTIIFPRIAAATTNPSGNPRYTCSVNTTTPGSDATKDLCLKFPNVNQFASNTQEYNLYFEAVSAVGNVSVQVLIRKYFGSGGSGSVEIPVTTETIQNSNSFFNVTLLFGTNESFSIGPNDDDYVQIVFRMPVNAAQNVTFTDFALIINPEILTTFPIETNAEQLDESSTGWLPTPLPFDGSAFYLPIVLTATGTTFDESIVGQIVAKPQLAANTVNNELMMDGTTYIASDYSALGIPFQRLATFLMNNAAAVSVTNGSSTSTLPAGYVPAFGTGPNFVTIFINATPGKFDLSMNTASGSNSVNNQTSGFTNVATDPLYVFTVPAVPAAGQFFSFTVQTGGPFTYNVWFSVNGSGTAPSAPSGANIQVKLVSADTVATTIAKIALAINGYQFQLIDLRGYFLRGLDPSSTTDPNASTRTLPGISDNTNPWIGAHIGSLQASAFASHVHPPLPPQTTFTGLTSGTSSVGGAGGHGETATTGAAGGSETRPINIAVNFFIRY